MKKIDEITSLKRWLLHDYFKKNTFCMKHSPNISAPHRISSANISPPIHDIYDSMTGFKMRSEIKDDDVPYLTREAHQFQQGTQQRMRTHNSLTRKLNMMLCAQHCMTLPSNAIAGSRGFCGAHQ